MKKRPQGHKHWYLLICVCLMLSTLAVYWPVRKHEFIKYDDDKYVTDNRHVQSGLTWQGLRWSFTTGHASNWHPVTWLSHMLDCQVFGTSAGPHHLVNVLLHIANTLLLFLVFQRTTKALWASAFVAAVFALHPLHVESVAWVAERKDVLSTLFWMLTMLAYVRYVERPKAAWYALALVFFVVGLMAKPMLVTLPFVLLLLDFWPLERMQLGKSVDNVSQADDARTTTAPTPILPLVVEKIPFFVFSLVSSIVTFIVQRKGGAVPTVEALGLASRVGNAIISYVAYIAKMFWPIKLAVLYPYAGRTLSLINIMLCASVLVLISLCIVRTVRGRRFLAVGWLWYVGTLVPVIGLVQVGVQAMADRYTYLPLTGLFIMVAWGAWELVAEWPYRRAILAASAVAVLSVAAVCTSRQIRYWRDSNTLFKHTLDVTTSNYIMHNNYANVLKEDGKIGEAIEQFYKSLAIKPDSVEVHNNLGNAFTEMGRIDDAIEHYARAIDLDPDLPEAHYNLAVCLAKRGDAEAAIAEYHAAIRLKHDYVDALSNLGYELAKQRKFTDAVIYYRRALELDPDSVIAHGRLGLALAGLSKYDAAIEQFRIVLKHRPDDVEMRCNLGFLLEHQGKTAEAIEQYRKALQINPNYAKARKLLQAVSVKRDDVKQE